MGQKNTYNKMDLAIKNVLNKYFGQSQLTIRDIENNSQGFFTYGRLYDIKTGRRGALKFSEFLALCTLLGRDTAKAIGDAYREFDRLEELEYENGEKDLTEEEKQTFDDLMKRLPVGEPADFHSFD